MCCLYLREPPERSKTISYYLREPPRGVKANTLKHISLLPLPARSVILCLLLQSSPPMPSARRYCFNKIASHIYTDRVACLLITLTSWSSSAGGLATIESTAALPLDVRCTLTCRRLSSTFALSVVLSRPVYDYMHKHASASHDWV